MTSPTETNVAICEALGLDPKHIRRNGISIFLDGDIGPVVTVEYQRFDKELAVMLSALKRYRLVPLDE